MARKDKVYAGEFGVNNQVFFCGIPFRLDSYSGCAHGCRYCFARSAELTNRSHLRRTNRPDILVPDPAQFKRTLVIALDQGLKRSDINIHWLRHRVPIHWGGMSDPFQPCEEKFRISRSYMEYLNWYEYPVAISTKGTDLATSPEYLSLLKEGKYIVQVSIIGDDGTLAQLEPNVPSPASRMVALSKLADAGIFTVARIQPVIPNTVIEKELPEFIYRLSKCGVRHVLTEGYKVQIRNNDWQQEVWQLFPEALQEYNYSDVPYAGFEKLLSPWRKYQYIKVAKQAANECGMTFGSADNDLRDLGDTICCCGLDNVPGFENFWRYQASQAVWIAREKGIVTLSDMKEHWAGSSERMDSGNVLNNEMFMEVYGYQKGKAKERDAKSSGAGLLKHIQDGEMRRTARASGTAYTAEYCVDWMWNNGGECSPEVLASMTKIDVGNEIAYKWQDPIPLLEAKQVKQTTMF